MTREKSSGKVLLLKDSPREFNEAELESLLCSSPSVLEDGLRFITNQYRMPEGDRIDMLCLDAQNSLVIVELKAHEDNSALFQALSYYAQLEPIKHFLKLHVAPDLDEQRPSKVILVAPSFSGALKQIVGFLGEAVNIKLVEFLSFATTENKPAVSFREVPAGVIVRATKPSTERDHIDYIVDESVRQWCEQIVAQLKRKGLQVIPVQSRLSFKRNGELHAIVHTRRNYFHVGVWDTKKCKWFDLGTIDSREKFSEVSKEIEAIF